MPNSNLQIFRSFLTERFSAVALEIFGEVENIVEGYREENKRLQNTLNAVLNPEIKLHRIVDQTYIASTTVVHEQPPEQRASLGPESPEPLHPTIKEEQVEYETGLEEEQPQGLEGAGNMNFILMPVCVKSDTEQDLSLGQTSNSYHDPVVECKSESASTIIAEEMAVKNETGTHGDLEATTDRSHLSRESKNKVQKCPEYEECGNSSEEMEWEAAEEKLEMQNKMKTKPNGNKRHRTLTEEELSKLEEDRHEKNTKKTTTWAVNTLHDYLLAKGMSLDLANYDGVALNNMLRGFYASVQTSKGSEYSVASLLALRAGLNRHITVHNIISDHVFKSCNSVFKSIIRNYRKSGKDTSAHHPPLTTTDLQLIRASEALSPNTPSGLVKKVWFDIQLHLARRGREGMRDLTRSSFILQQDENGTEYVCLSHNLETKKHRNPTDPSRESLCGFMFAEPGNLACPVESFKTYISKCPPDAKAFYLHPRRGPQSTLVPQDIWYSKEPMGVNFLGGMLKRICEEGGKLGSTKRIAKRPLQKTMLEFPRMTHYKPLTCELTDYKPFLSRLTEAFKDIPDDKKPLIAKMGLSNNVELVDCAFGKVPKGCPLSYQCPVPSSRDYSPHEDAPLPPSLPQSSQRLEPILSIPDLSAKEQEHMKALETTWDAAHNLERSTRELRESMEELRKSRLTSRFRDICHLKSGRSHGKHLVFKMQKGTPKSKTATLDKEQRPEALREYCKHMLVNWSPCGLVVHPDAPWLGAMPDGLVYDPTENPKYGLVHVKLPKTRSFVDCKFLNFQYGILELKKTHACYWQMQGEMMVTGTEWCDLVVYAKEDILVQRVYRNKAMIKVMKEKLDSFFFYYYLPSLTNV